MALAPSFLQNLKTLGPADRLRTAHIGLGYQGLEDLRDIASHPQVDVVALCDVDQAGIDKALAAALQAVDGVIETQVKN